MNDKSELLGRLKIDKDFQPAQSGKHKLWLAAGAGGLILVLLIGWLLWGTKPSFAVQTAMARMEASAARGGQVILQATGYVTARRQSTVSSKVTGKIMQVLVEEGDEVQQNQVLAVLDESNERKQMQLAESELQSARARVNETRARVQEAEQTLKRARELSSRQLISRAELDSAEAEHKSLAAQLQTRLSEITTAENSVQLQQQMLDDLIIRAPFAGVVVAKNAQPGEIISPMSAGGGFTRTGICSLVDMASREIEVDVNEAYIDRIQAGQTVQAVLDAYPEWRIAAKVNAVVPTADRQKATVKVRISFDQLDPRILPDMGVKVSFMQTAPAAGESPQQNAAIRVPASAVRTEDGQQVMYVVVDGKAARRSVEASDDGDSILRIASGLEPGETYIVEIPADLKDGSAVEVR
jgi:RND family efflux transporter MFP subunit